MTKRNAAATLLLRNVALLVHGYLDLGTAAHRATMPEAVRALRQALDVLVAVGLDALLRDPGLARHPRGGVGGIGVHGRRGLVDAGRRGAACAGRGWGHGRATGTGRGGGRNRRAPTFGPERGRWGRGG